MNISRIRNIFGRSVPQALRRFVPEFLYKHIYTQGKIKVSLKGNKFLFLWTQGYDLENQIYWRGINGCHEPLSMRIWIEICASFKPAEIWDIGANTGVYGLVAKIESPLSNVSFFEPLAECIRILEINIELNGIEAIVYQVALADYVGKSTIALNVSEDFGYAAGLGAQSLPGHRSVEVDVNIAKAYLENSQNLPQLVKLDVETFEPNVLRGFGSVDFINTIFLIELLSEEVASQVQSFFDPKKFEFINIDDVHCRLRKQERLSSSFTYNFLIYPKALGKSISSLLDNYLVL